MACKAAKKKANEFGIFAEEMAVREYIKRGYVIKERNMHLGSSEIDIIVQKDNTVVIAEVKARKSSEEDALNAVNKEKRRRMVRAADSYLRKYQGKFYYRFDIVVCIGNKYDYKLEIFEDAFLSTDLL